MTIERNRQGYGLGTGFDMPDSPCLSLLVILFARFRSYNICRLKERTVSADKMTGVAGRGQCVCEEWMVT
jgi:hypothetical protein